MTTTIIARTAARATETEANPEYACSRCRGWHAGPCTATPDQQLGALLTHMAREADTRIPESRRARRTLQEMMPGYERQPLLILHRPVTTGGWCPLCERWTCDPSNCPPLDAAPAPADAASHTTRQAVTA